MNSDMDGDGRSAPVVPPSSHSLIADVQNSATPTSLLHPDEEVLPHGRWQRSATAAAAAAAVSGANNSRGELASGLKSQASGSHLGQRSLHHTQSYQDGHEPGAAPGLDVKRRKYDHLHQKHRTRVNVECIDYSDTQVQCSPQMTNADIHKFLLMPRPAWSRVRWLNIEGISWDVIEEVARHYDIHPLAVEDIVHIPQRIKCDLYDGFVYVSLILVTVEKNEDNELVSAPVAIGRSSVIRRREGDAAPLTSYASGNNDVLTALLSGYDEESGVDVHRQSLCTRTQFDSKAQRTRLFTQPMNSATPNVSSNLRREINVLTEQVSLFLLRDGTLISIFQQEGDSVTRPILEQVQEARTLLRDSQDPSFLLNLLVDAVVDHAFPVVDTYGALLQRFEERMLVGRPDASVTRELHVMQGDLRLLKHTLLPANAVVNMLRSRHIEMTTISGGGCSNGLTERPGTPGGGGPRDRASLISDLTRTYLSDVQDHLSQLLEAMDTMGTHAKDCIDLCFNLTSHATNQAMQTLAVVSAVFLPITFLAGVYGANFDYMPELHWEYGYLYFWMVCITVTVLFVIVLARLGMLRSL